MGEGFDPHDGQFMTGYRKYVLQRDGRGKKTEYFTSVLFVYSTVNVSNDYLY